MQLLAWASAGGLTSLGLVLAVMAGLGLWLQSRRRVGPGVVRGTVGLGGQHALHVVELDGRRLLVGTGPAAAPRLLTELAPPVAGPGERDGGRA